jgi:HAD superfamily hydrolase (TIGR01509 family)
LLHRIDTILFDWDGTLIDTAQRAFDAFVKQFRALGIPIDWETYERIYSPNWYNMYVDLGLPPERWKEADNLWLQHYGSEVPRPMPGIVGVLEDLVGRNYVLGIVTNGTRERVLREIDDLELRHVFRIVVCHEDVVNRKPHPEGLELAIRRMQKSPGVCCYVGDSPDDIAMGRSAGVLTVGIMGRYPTGRKLLDANPDRCFNSLEQFLNMLPRAGNDAVRSTNTSLNSPSR